MSLFHAAFMTFFISMVPVLELRGAIPAGVAGGLTPLAAMLIAMVGNLVPIPFLILFTRRVLNWLKTMEFLHSFVVKLENRAAEKSQIVLKYASVGLCILVAIPLPGTGAWTGALVAAILNLRLKKAMPAIIIGVIIAGFIVTCLTYGATHLLG